MMVVDPGFCAEVVQMNPQDFGSALLSLSLPHLLSDRLGQFAAKSVDDDIGQRVQLALRFRPGLPANPIALRIREHVGKRSLITKQCQLPIGHRPQRPRKSKTHSDITKMIKHLAKKCHPQRKPRAAVLR